ncbi:hypothetical protein [Sphingobacterium ginsenosidimutans]|uniref:Uncharacterized protein n=1 Tax=Sphingobacterium ginsenosidimutans TaxID=687845 RepID=A0ABP8AA71_9SPHI
MALSTSLQLNENVPSLGVPGLNCKGSAIGLSIVIQIANKLNVTKGGLWLHYSTGFIRNPS